MGGRPGGRVCLGGRLCTLRPPAGEEIVLEMQRGPGTRRSPGGQESPARPCRGPQLQAPDSRPCSGAPTGSGASAISPGLWEEAQTLLPAAATPPGHVWPQILESEPPPRKRFQKLGNCPYAPIPLLPRGAKERPPLGMQLCTPGPISGSQRRAQSSSGAGEAVGRAAGPAAGLGSGVCHEGRQAGKGVPMPVKLESTD